MQTVSWMVSVQIGWFKAVGSDIVESQQILPLGRPRAMGILIERLRFSKGIRMCIGSFIDRCQFNTHAVGVPPMSAEGFWDDASKGDIGTLRERFNILEGSTYASPRMTMRDGSVRMVAERAPPLIGALVAIAVGIILPFFVHNKFGPLEVTDSIMLGVVLLVFSGAGLLLLKQHLKGDKWLFIHEGHLELRYDKGGKGNSNETKHIPVSDVVKILSHERVSVHSDSDGSSTTSESDVTSILVYNPDHPESRTDLEFCRCMTDIHSSTKTESDAIAVALNFLILGTPLPSKAD
jgi:hypothetical protein